MEFRVAGMFIASRNRFPARRFTATRPGCSPGRKAVGPRRSYWVRLVRPSNPYIQERIIQAGQREARIDHLEMRMIARGDNRAPRDGDRRDGQIGGRPRLLPARIGHREIPQRRRFMHPAKKKRGPDLQRMHLKRRRLKQAVEPCLGGARVVRIGWFLPLDPTLNFHDRHDRGGQCVRGRAFKAGPRRRVRLRLPQIAQHVRVEDEHLISARPGSPPWREHAGLPGLMLAMIASNSPSPRQA